MKHLICILGIHDWGRIYGKYKDSPQKEIRCNKCKKEMSEMYDSSGKSYWIEGRHWSQ